MKYRTNLSEFIILRQLIRANMFKPFEKIDFCDTINRIFSIPVSLVLSKLRPFLKLL